MRACGPWSSRCELRRSHASSRLLNWRCPQAPSTGQHGPAALRTAIPVPAYALPCERCTHTHEQGCATVGCKHSPAGAAIFKRRSHKVQYRSQPVRGFGVSRACGLRRPHQVQLSLPAPRAVSCHSVSRPIRTPAPFTHDEPPAQSPHNSLTTRRQIWPQRCVDCPRGGHPCIPRARHTTDENVARPICAGGGAARASGCNAATGPHSGGCGSKRGGAARVRSAAVLPARPCRGARDARSGAAAAHTDSDVNCAPERTAHRLLLSQGGDAQRQHRTPGGFVRSGTACIRAARHTASHATLCATWQCDPHSQNPVGVRRC